MDDFLGAIVVFLIFILSASRSKKKKEKKQQQKLERQQRRAASAQPAKNAAAGQSTAQASAPKPEPRAAQAAMQREPDCEKRPLHLHSVSQTVMESAGEGEDPCHPGGRPADAHDDVPVAQPNELAQELLRGIVVSEILTRPCDRMAMQRNRRRA